MARHSCLLAISFLLVPIIATDVTAATITLILDLSVPGTFTLSATASAGDNLGIVDYGIPLLGNVLTLDHRAPVTINAANSAAAGFSELRSADIVSTTINPMVVGSQSVFGPPANFIRGIGQEASSFAAHGISPLVSPDVSSDSTWLNPIILATGIYSGSLAFNTRSVDLAGNVFPVSQSTVGYPRATIQTLVIVPEPTTVSLIPFALICGIGITRRRRSAA
jgi:hypothetical protein